MEDGPTFSGPPEAFCQPGSKVTFARGREISEGIAVISHVDVDSKTIYFTSPMPAGIKPGDFVVMKGK